MNTNILINDHLFYHYNLKINEAYIYALIHKNSNINNYFQISYNKMSKITGITYKTLRKIIDKFVSLELITQEKDNNSYKYKLNKIVINEFNKYPYTYISGLLVEFLNFDIRKSFLVSYINRIQKKDAIASLSYENLAKKLNMDDLCIIKYINELADLKIIKKLKGAFGKSNSYLINDKYDNIINNNIIEANEQNKEVKVDAAVSDDFDKINNAKLSEDINNLIEQKINNEDVKLKFNEFIILRMQKEKITLLQVKLLIERLYSLTNNSNEQIDIINNSIVGNYKNFFFTHSKRKNNFISKELEERVKKVVDEWRDY